MGGDGHRCRIAPCNSARDGTAGTKAFALPPPGPPPKTLKTLKRHTYQPHHIQASSRASARTSRSSSSASRAAAEASKLVHTVFDLTGRTGSYLYMSPEVARCEAYNDRADVRGPPVHNPGNLS